MSKELRLKFAETMSELEGKEYLEAMVAFAAAPTIRGKKPASLMSFTFQGKNTADLWFLYGEEICKRFRLDHFKLKISKDSLVVLLYRMKLLEEHVNRTENRIFLNKMGYEFANRLERKIEILKHRFKEQCPHEVGVFLGMPIEDVEGFIEHKGKNCLLCRYWKVYGDIRQAKRIFDAYDKAKASMVELVVRLRERRQAECI